MNTHLAKKLARKMKSSAGFTLLEILVVLTIMGFLIAMVAPRLAGISSSAVDTVCDSNQQRMVTMMSAYFEQTGGFPNKMTNLVCQDGDTDYVLPSVEDGNPDTGPGVFADEFNKRNKFRIHYLNSAEAKELKEMGIQWVNHLNDYTNSSVANTNKRSFMNSQQIGAGTGVLMIAAGAPSTTGAIEVSTNATDNMGFGEPDWVGRIILGFGPENGLITSGLVSNAAHCPGGIQNADKVKYNDYNLVLPRLKATVARTDGTPTVGLLALETTNSVIDQYYAVAYTDDTAPATYVYNATNLALKKRVIKWVGQEPYQYATQCPEGHMFPADDEDYWALGNDNTFSFTID